MDPLSLSTTYKDGELSRTNNSKEVNSTQVVL